MGPIAAGLTAFFGFIVTFDFSDLRARHPSWPGFFDLLEDYKNFYIFILCVVIAFLTTVLISFLSPTRQQLRVELEAERVKMSRITDHVEFVLQGFVWQQAKKLGFSQEGYSRISLYMHEPDKRRFHCLVRRSHNTKFEQKGRQFFDDSTGCIAKAWESDWHFDNNFPDDPSENAAYQKATYGIKKAVHSNLTMDSKLIAAKRVVDNNDRPLGLLVVESVKRDGFDEANLRNSLTVAASDCALLISAWKDHLPSPNIAESEGL